VLDGTQLIVSSTISPQVRQRQDVTVLHLLMIMLNLTAVGKPSVKTVMFCFL